MLKCQLIFCEKLGEWAAALRVIAPLVAVEIVEVRSLAGASEALRQAPASLAAVHATGENLPAVVEFFLAVGQRFPAARTIGLLSAGDEANALVLREAGAVDVICSVLDLPRLADAASRQAARTPLAETTIHEFVQAILPWKSRTQSLPSQPPLLP